MIIRPRLLAIAAFCAIASSAGTPIHLSGERRLAFNDGWRFLKGEASGAEQPGFSDQQWRVVQLPHDWGH